jgi:hypothetical protein
MFNYCLVALMGIISTSMLAAILIPAKISVPEESLHSDAIMQLIKASNQHYSGTIALIVMIWAVLLLALTIPEWLKGRNR